MVWNWFFKKSKVSKHYHNNYNREPFESLYFAGLSNQTSFSPNTSYINILTFQYEVYKPSVEIMNKLRYVSGQIFNGNIEVVIDDDENTDYAQQTTKKNYGILEERNINEKSPIKHVSLKDPQLNNGSHTYDKNILEEIEQLKWEFIQRFQTQQDELNSITTKFQSLQQTLTKANDNYRKKSAFSKSTFEGQVKSLKEKYDGLLQDQITKTQDTEKTLKNKLKDKTQEIEKLRASIELNTKTMTNIRDITLFGIPLGGDIIDYLKTSNNNNNSFEELFKNRHSNFTSFSNSSIIQSIETNQQEFLQKIETLTVQPQGNDSKVESQEINTNEMTNYFEEFKGEYKKDIMNCTKDICKEINEMSNQQIQMFESLQENQISTKQLSNEVQKNNNLTSNFNRLQNDMVSVRRQLEIEIDINNKLKDNAKLQEITLNNLQTKYKMLKGDTNKKLTWNQMCEINADSKREVIGFDRIEALSHITLQNLVKQFCVILAIPVDHMVTQLYQIGIVLKYERNILEYFINRLVTEWKGRKILFETYREAAFQQFKQHNSLNNIEHPLLKEMNDLVDALLYKL
ncbi:hypothetical protein MOSE0_A00276 [Monosporozyma servazzii]